MLNQIQNHPFLSYAFRPFYSAAALFAGIAVLVWAFSYEHYAHLFLWHAHEMIWGYTGAVIVGFLLTAVATWTGTPPTSGWRILLLLVLWLIGRVTPYFTQTLVIAGPADALFYLASTYFFGKPIIQKRSKRNYLPIAGLLLFGGVGSVFDTAVLNHHEYDSIVIQMVYAGVLLAAGFIGFIGMRVIPFFTSRRLGVQQVISPMYAHWISLALPMVSAILLFLFPEQLRIIIGLCVLVCGLSNGYQLIRWLNRKLWTEPMLWVLYLGFGSTSLGLIAFGLVELIPMPWLNISGAIHLITVGGIGLMTLGMMSRTALGHTGRAIAVVKPMRLAFILMFISALVRFTASLSIVEAHYVVIMQVSAILFALAMFMFVGRYALWLWQPRFQANSSPFTMLRSK